jgi:hypothetical protein
MATEKKISSEKSVISNKISEEEIMEKSHKGITVFTYVIALLCLLAGLLVPLYGNGSSITDKMLLLHLPDAVNVALGGTPLFSGAWVKPFTDTYYITVFGLPCSILAWTVVIYAAITVLGIIFLIPVIAGSRKNSTSAVCAYFIEVLAVVTLAVHIFFAITARNGWLNYPIWIAFGGTLFMLVIQSIVHKGGLGVLKFFVLILTAISVLALFDITVWVKALAAPLNTLTNMINASSLFVDGRYGVDYFLNCFFNLLHISTVYPSTNLPVVIAATVTATLVVINAFFDIIGLATGSRFEYHEEKYTGYNKETIHNFYEIYHRNTASKVFALIRYMLEFIAAIVTIVLLLTAGMTIGIYLYIVTLVAFILVFITVIRLCLLKSEKMQEALWYNEHLNNSSLAKDLTSSDDDEDDEDDYDDYDEDDDDDEDDEDDEDDDYDDEPETDRKSETTIVNTYNSYTYNEAPAEPVKEEPEEEEDIEEETVEEETSEEETVEEETVEETPQPAAPIYEYPTTAQTNDYPEPEPFEYPEPEYPESQTAAQAVPQPAQPVNEMAEAQAVEEQTYTGPTDEFINTLTNAEKIEFAEVFIDKTKGKLPKIPDYVVGGNNEEFFPAIFIYLGKFRTIISNDLLNKIYKHVNLMY